MVGNVRRTWVSPAELTSARAALAPPSYCTISLSPSRWLLRSSGSVSSSTSKSRWSSLPVAIRRCASLGTTSVWSLVRCTCTGMRSRPLADSKPTTWPLSPTSTWSPVMSWIRWLPSQRVVFGVVVVVVADVAMDAAGPVMPATRATEVAAVTVKARALSTCARKSPPGAWDEVDRSFRPGAQRRPTGWSAQYVRCGRSDQRRDGGGGLSCVTSSHPHVGEFDGATTML